MHEIFMHSAKFLNKNIDLTTRVFVVTEHSLEGRTRFYTAWKCTLTPQGLMHPAYNSPLPLTPDGLLKARMTVASNGSEPTAVFRRDSFYTRVFLSDLLALQATLSWEQSNA